MTHPEAASFEADAGVAHGSRPANAATPEPAGGARGVQPGDAAADDYAGSLAVTLPVVSVSATRSSTPLADPSAAVSDIGRAEIQRSAARSVDELLRRIPGFSLFRRLGSGAAHPTTQGVSLRGLGPSGTSRALVLVDGIPLNDPFGGWIYWNSIPTETIERIEVLRGSGASLWGNYAMGGVIDVITRMPENGAGFIAEGGEHGQARTAGWVARRLGATSAQVDGAWSRSGEYPVIRADVRGPIDGDAGSEYGSGGLRVDHDVSDTTRLRMVLRGFHENRDNGTPYTGNETTRGFLRTGMDIDAGSRGKIAADVFGTLQEFSSTFSAVTSDRISELPASNQFDVPSSSAGGSLVWTSDAGGRSGAPRSRHRLVAGTDALWVEGRSEEYARYIEGGFTRRRNGGAAQVLFGLFVEDVMALTETIDVTGALRLDRWQSYDGFRREIDTTTGTALVDRGLPSRSETLLNPRLGMAWQAFGSLAVRSAVYRGFRAPTINEQVRPFRVRNDITEANADLSPEKLFGVEGGFDHGVGSWRTSATLFWNEIEDPVFNVTVGQGGAVVDPCGFVPAGGTCRQRRNLGRSSILGLETGTGIDVGHGLSASVAYLWTNGEIRSAADDPTLVGNRLPQVPRHQGTFAFDYDDGGSWHASLQVRVVGRQYEDDANTRSLSPYATVDAFVGRDLGAGFEVFVAAENLFDKTVESGVSADGVVSIGAPRLVRAGVRWTFGGDRAATR